MIEERVKNLETQMGQITGMFSEIIRIVGKTNALVEELRSDVEELCGDMEQMKTEIKK